ncbi:MAG: hypothetical protein WBD02_03285 [Acidimicrobiia bacterium]
MCGVIAVTALFGACSSSSDTASKRSTSDRSTSDASSSASKGSKTSTSAATPVEMLPKAAQELEFNATEYTFAITPDPSAGLKPGWTLVKFHNIGGEPHQVMFARIKDGVDMADLAAAGAGDSSGAGAIAFVDMIGGISYIAPNQDTTAMVYLTEGTVMAMCYVPDANGVAHALSGMTTTLTVSAPVDAPAATEPKFSDDAVLGTIELSKDGYQIPDDLGTGWYHVKNTDTALHELSMLRLGHSITEDQAKLIVSDLAANKIPEVEVTAVGGMGAISAGFDGYLYLDLKKGDYLAVDFMPDPGEPRPHMLDGYYAKFSSTGSDSGQAGSGT